MYDYVMMLLFDEDSEIRIRKMKDFLKRNKITSREKPWAPHITVDLYQGITKELLIEKTDHLTETLRMFPVIFETIDNFHQRVLFLKPEAKAEFWQIKQKADELLGKYRVRPDDGESYVPHVTLAINKDIREATELIQAEFRPFSGEISYLALYQRNMELVKLYRLAEDHRNL